MIARLQAIAATDIDQLPELEKKRRAALEP
jgi:hypothetical protein